MFKACSGTEREHAAGPRIPDHFGVSSPTRHRYESGARVPGLVVLQKLLEEHDISIDWLFFNHGPKQAGEKGGGKALEKLTKRNQELERELAALKQAAAYSRPTETETRSLQFLQQCEEQVGPVLDPADLKPEML